MIHTNNAAAAATKPCSQCGTPVPVGVLICGPCTKENILQFFKSHPDLKRRAY